MVLLLGDVHVFPISIRMLAVKLFFGWQFVGTYGSDVPGMPLAQRRHFRHAAIAVTSFPSRCHRGDVISVMPLPR